MIGNIRSRWNGAHLEFYDQATGVTIYTIDDSGAVDFAAGKLKLGGTTITATAAELNVVAGVAAGLSAAELGVLDGITATTAELNVLDVVTATSAQLNFLAGVTAGTSAASKAVVLSAASKIDALDVTALKINGVLQTAVGTTTCVNAVNAFKVLTVGAKPADNETVKVGATTYTFQNSIGVAVAASGLLTVAGVPHDKTELLIGTTTYRWRDEVGAGTASSGTLTVLDAPHNATTVVIGGKTYNWRTAAMAGVKATGTLTFSNVAVAAETVTIDVGGPAKVYTWVTALTEAPAVSTLTLTANMSDGNSVTIGTTKYTFREVLAAAYDVLIDVSASVTIDNLIAAINGAAGESSTYGTGTVAHPDVTAAIGIGDTMDITAKVIGVAGNAIDTTELSTVASWTAGHMASGVDAIANEVVVTGAITTCIDNLVAAATGAAGVGTTYSTGTTAHTTVDVTKASGTEVLATAKSIGVAGNAIDTEDTMTNADWTAGHLANGVAVGVANDVLVGTAEESIDNLVLAITGGAGAGTNYGTGTVAHTLVTAVKATAATMTVTAKTAGVAGDAIGTTTAADHCSFGVPVVLEGGVDPGSANDVLFTTAEAGIDNLVLAIMGTGVAGTNYGAGTAEHTTVTAVKASAATMTVTAKTAGDAGNAIVTTTAADHCSFGAGTLTLGEGAEAANDVLIGADAQAAIDNLVLAITGVAGAGTNFGTGTAPNASCTAVKTTAASMTVTAKVAGVSGNSIALDETLSNGSWALGATALGGGVDGTVGAANQMHVDSTYLYVAVAANTVADKNWRRIAVGAAY
jgi:hypothetical protein